MKKESRHFLRQLDRRTFVKLLPAMGAAGLGASRLAPIARAQQQSPQAPQRITKEMLRSAEQIIGIELTDAQETMALMGVNNNLGNYETLRKLDIPLDTEPAFAFHPLRPRKKFAVKLGRIRASRVEAPKFSSIEDLAFATTAQLSELVRTRRVSPVELTRMYLARLKKYGPRLLCVVTLMEESALREAGQAEQEIRRGKYRGPLHGIPWGAKDLFAAKGYPTTWGAEPFQNQMIDMDATVVEKLRAAGAVLVAKLSMGALAQGGRWFKGVTRNPWQPEEDRIGSSGSSAGSASATSAGLVGFSLGTETLGSIISPSSRCGVVGLRPTYGRVSRYGAMGLSWTMDKIGP
ncbi:MAG TPA: amidase, partial [Blastocatellia bacterium]